jgi:hypothetical protein
MLREDALLVGAFDVHAHGYPEFTLGMPPRVDNVAWAELAAQAGLRGFVVKSHVWPTTTTAHMLRSLQPGLEVVGSITCNPPVGGLNPVSVEIAAQTGARVVWMPTWSARQDPPKPSVFLERMKPWVASLETDPAAAAEIDILGPDRALRPEVVRILRLCRQYGMTLATGHLPITASMLLIEEAESLGVRVILTHPLSGSVGASLDDQRAAVAHGAVIEHVFIGCMPMHQRADPRRIVEAIDAVGAEHCVLGSDAIEAWNPPQPEVLRMFIATLLALGVDEGAVRAMTHENPVHALGLEARAAQPAATSGADPEDVQ